MLGSAEEQRLGWMHPVGSKHRLRRQTPGHPGPHPDRGKPSEVEPGNLESQALFACDDFRVCNDSRAWACKGLTVGVHHDHDGDGRCPERCIFTTSPSKPFRKTYLLQTHAVKINFKSVQPHRASKRHSPAVQQQNRDRHGELNPRDPSPHHRDVLADPRRPTRRLSATLVPPPFSPRRPSTSATKPTIKASGLDLSQHRTLIYTRAISTPTPTLSTAGRLD